MRTTSRRVALLGDREVGKQHKRRRRMGANEDIDVTTTYFGHDYKGISLVSMPDYTRSSNSIDGPPFLVYFNSGEKKGVTTLEDMKAPLAKRFPLSEVPLRKCTSAGGGTARQSSPR